MKQVKDTKSGIVRIGYDGRVHKFYRGPLAQRRFENETAVLEYLERVGCPFVPRILEKSAETCSIITTNCGSMVRSLGDEKLRQLFLEIEQFGIRHGDPFVRNVTYNPQQGRFNLIDFEFATFLSTGKGLTVEDVEAALKADPEHGNNA